VLVLGVSSRTSATELVVDAIAALPGPPGHRGHGRGLGAVRARVAARGVRARPLGGFVDEE